VKLLFDQNLSHKLITTLAEFYPDSLHTRFLGFERVPDAEIWFYARTHGCTIVTKDSDLGELAVLRGAPPKVIWLRIGNCSTAAVEKVLRDQARTIKSFANDPARIVLELFD
jgi:predicted nuclease of predicted toxin-antitoxin system